MKEELGGLLSTPNKVEKWCKKSEKSQGVGLIGGLMMKPGKMVAAGTPVQGRNPQVNKAPEAMEQMPNLQSYLMERLHVPH